MDEPEHSYDLFVPNGVVPIKRYDRTDVAEHVAFAKVFRDGDGVRHIQIPKNIKDELFEVVLKSDGYTPEERKRNGSE